METCESFANAGTSVELWVPIRFNRTFRGADPFAYHGVKRTFTLHRLLALDMIAIGGRFGNAILTVSFGFSVFAYALFRGFFSRVIFYGHDPYDVFFLLFAKQRVFVEIHELYGLYRKFPRLTRSLFSRAEGILVTNKFKGAILEKEFGVPREKILVQQNAADISLFRIDMPRDEARTRLKLPLEKRVFLYTGHLFDWKGRDTLFESHKYLKGNELLYIVGGTPGDVLRFKDRLREKGITNIILSGERPHDEIPVWLRASDALLVPHSGKFDIARFEASPVKLFEYMASGRPIVVSELPSMREIVDESMVWFSKPDDAESLVQTARRAAEEGKRFGERQKKAQVEVKKYSWEARSLTILSFIRNTHENTVS
jgi:glycosyltransferase involved in cell wall biosynthesis